MRRLLGEVGPVEWRLPDLNGVMLLRLVLGLEQHQRAVVEDRVAVADDRRVDAARDQVVRHQRVLRGLPLIENNQVVFAVGADNRALVVAIGHRARERLRDARCEVVAGGEDDPVFLGQQLTGRGDCVLADHLARLGVEDEMPCRLLLERLDPQQHDRALHDVVNLGVVERLIWVVDGLGVDAHAGLRVVLDLDRQIATGALNEDEVFDRDVRVQPGALHLARRALPIERRLPGVTHLVIRAWIEVVQSRAVGPVAGLDRPLERLEVVDILADVELHVHVRRPGEETGEACVLVVAIEVGEVFVERAVGDQVQRLLVEPAVGEAIHR
ncbi:MAG: hypothetical protein AAGF73_19290 [Actinomycetota bacterium]